MITKINIFKEQFNFSIERPKPKNWSQLHDLVNDAIDMYGNECDLNFIDTSLITDISYLFAIGNFENFNGDISQWDVSNVTDMICVFNYSQFNGDISKWDVSNVKDMTGMFDDSEFTGNIDDWTVKNICDTTDMFTNSELKKLKKLPKWYKLPAFDKEL